MPVCDEQACEVAPVEDQPVLLSASRDERQVSLCVVLDIADGSQNKEVDSRRLRRAHKLVVNRRSGNALGRPALGNDGSEPGLAKCLEVYRHLVGDLSRTVRRLVHLAHDSHQVRLDLCLLVERAHAFEDDVRDVLDVDDPSKLRDRFRTKLPGLPSLSFHDLLHRNVTPNEAPRHLGMVRALIGERASM